MKKLARRHQQQQEQQNSQRLGQGKLGPGGQGQWVEARAGGSNKTSAGNHSSRREGNGWDLCWTSMGILGSRETPELGTPLMGHPSACCS